MRIRINKNARNIYLASLPTYAIIDWNLVATLDMVAGHEYDVKTYYLFSDQFEIEKFPLSCTYSVWIPAVVVDQVIDDVRIGRKFCRYCNRHSEVQAPVCTHCGQSTYFEELT